VAFRFRLEKVARYRQLLVDEQGRRVAEAGQAVQALLGRIAALDADIGANLVDFNDDSPPAVSVQGMLARTLWVSHLDRLRDEAVLELQGARAELAARQERLNAVWRDLEVLNKLREKQKAEWRHEQEHREKLELDEVGQIRADRQRRSKVAT
jgi:flagellar export protein FliJ